MIDLSSVVLDPRFAQSFTVYRKVGAYNAGRFEETEAPIIMTGTISIASEQEIEQIPEGDRVNGGIVIHTKDIIYTTRTNDGTQQEGGTSDELEWCDERYKICSVSNYSYYGYYKAIGQRMASC